MTPIFSSADHAQNAVCGYTTDRLAHRLMACIPYHPLIEINREEVEALCRRHGVRSLEVFGSVMREDFDAATSDVYIIVDFQPIASGSGCINTSALRPTGTRRTQGPSSQAQNGPAFRWRKYESASLAPYGPARLIPMGSIQMQSRYIAQPPGELLR